MLEAKGGESQCGERKSKIYKKKVKQGTDEYLEDVADTMAKSNYKSKSKQPADVLERKRRKSVGTVVTDAIKQSTGTVIYSGVRGGYGDKGAFNPESIFTKTL